MTKKITKKMMKGLLNLNDVELGFDYNEIINDINSGIKVDYCRNFTDDIRIKNYNRALRDVLVALLFIQAGYHNGNIAESCQAREDMREVMYKYNIATSNTSEQNLRGLHESCFSYMPQAFQFSACLNMGLNHFDITKK